MLRTVWGNLRSIFKRRERPSRRSKIERQLDELQDMLDRTLRTLAIILKYLSGPAFDIRIDKVCIDKAALDKVIFDINDIGVKELSGSLSIGINCGGKVIRLAQSPPEKEEEKWPRVLDHNRQRGGASAPEINRHEVKGSKGRRHSKDDASGALKKDPHPSGEGAHLKFTGLKWREPPNVFDDSERGKWPPLDILETDTEVIIAVAAPGVRQAGDIKAVLMGNTLTLQGMIPPAPVVSRRSKTHCAEIPHGKFKRTITLPAGIKSMGARASYQRGVLKIRLAKLPGGHGETIPINFFD